MNPLPLPSGSPLAAWNDGPADHFVLTRAESGLVIEHYTLVALTGWALVGTAPLPQGAVHAALDAILGSEDA